jgi:SNF2 family DNA or RNA helicase
LLKLRDYQETAADFLYEHDRAMILAPVGAGKTAITLTAMQAMLDGGYAKRFLVLAPKRVCTDVWPVEQKLWAHQMSLSVCVGSIKQRLASLSSSAQVVVTNYDNLQWLAKQTLDFDAVVFDELTRLKNPSGARFKALHKVLDCPIRWGLTGSFTSNGLEDVFGQCKIVDQSLLGRSKGAFQQQYFVLINKEYGEWAPRVGSLEKVMAVIKPATFVLEAGDYTLPSLNIVPVMCAMDLTHYNKMKKDFVVEFPTAKAVALNAGVVTGKLQQMASGFVYDANSSIWFSSHKFDRLDELLAENQRANTIIAYTYQEELAELKRRYPKAQTLDDTKAIERWNAGKIEMLLVHPKSAGHGLNLQHGGCNMVFLSLPWSLELYEQTIGRLHRSGQKNAVWVYVMTTLKTVDERIYAALQDKRAISDIAMEELK